MINTSKFNLKTYSVFRKKVLTNVLKMAYHGGSNSAHIGGALSMTDLCSVIFKYFLNLDKFNIAKKDRDYFILSKGHACLTYYSLLAEKGFLNENDFQTFEKDATKLLGHPVKNPEIGIDFSTGSLGMGAGISVGVAMGLKKIQSKNKVYAVIGDGECNEGSVWEAFMTAYHYKLDNLTFIIDKNNFQQTGPNNEILNIESLIKKISSFNLETFEVDGHDPQLIYDTLKIFTKNRPKAIIGNTRKGKYLSFSEDNNQFHHAVLTKSLYEQGISEIENLQ